MQPASERVGPIVTAPALALTEPTPAPVASRAAHALAREVWNLAWPAITHMLLITTVFFTGRVLVGRYSPTALASLQISGTLTWTVYSLFTAFSAATLAVVARSTGAGDRESAARATRASMMFAFAIGIVVAAAFLIANGAFLRLLFPRAGADVLHQASAYMHIVVPLLPLAFVEATAAAALQGSGDTRTPLYVASVGSVVNVALSAALVFGKFGFPEMGVRGAAIGAASTMAVEGLILTAFLFSKRSPLPLRDVRAVLVFPAFRRVARVALPAFGEKVVYHGAYLAFVAIIGLLGAAAMAANQGLISIEAVSFLSADGFGVAAAAMVAQKLGKKRPEEALVAGQLSAGFATVALTTFGIFFAVAPRALASIFSDDPAIIDLGAQTLLVAAVAQPFMAYATVIGMALRGAGDTKTVLLVMTVCSFAVRLAATWFFAVTLGMGLVGVWMGSGADWFVRSIWLGILWRRGNWKAATA
ncbi:MAG: MATE family efflux transporter [Polyangiaceae bacterium]|nr:MATE family efflux transporter [Polyangiaceae bacterium]